MGRKRIGNSRHDGITGISVQVSCTRNREIINNNRHGGDRRRTAYCCSVAVAAAAAAAADRRQVRDAPASTRLIFSTPVPPGLWVSGPVAIGLTVAVATTGCCPKGTPCPSVSTIPTRSSAKIVHPNVLLYREHYGYSINYVEWASTHS
jgi:hypothetical protein